MTATKSKKRFIQIGLGGWGGYWVHTVMPWLIRELNLVEAAAVCDTNPETFVGAMHHYGLPAEKCYTDAAKAFAENEADFAVIVTPPWKHAEMIDLALAQGLDILCEKPIAANMAECASVYKKVKQAGRKMAVTQSHRFDQDKQTLERLIKSGDFGKLGYIVGRNTWDCRDSPKWGAFRYQMPDVLLIEGTVHHFDIMRALTGSNAKTVYANTWHPEWGDFEGDCQALVTVEMENGVRVFWEGAKANATTLNGWLKDYWRSECEHATLELDNRRLRSIKGDLFSNATIQEIPLDTREVWMNPWLAEQFVGWLNGGEPPATQLEDNIQCAALTFAAVESAHAGAVVNVQEFLRESLAL